jgi:hypothetical protein
MNHVLGSILNAAAVVVGVTFYILVITKPGRSDPPRWRVFLFGNPHKSDPTQHPK